MNILDVRNGVYRMNRVNADTLQWINVLIGANMNTNIKVRAVKDSG